MRACPDYYGDSTIPVIGSIILKVHPYVSRQINVDDVPDQVSYAVTCGGAQVLRPGKMMGTEHAFTFGRNRAGDLGGKGAVRLRVSIGRKRFRRG